MCKSYSRGFDIKEYNMDTFNAFIKGEINRGKELKVFDWEKAARIIKDKKAKNVSAGLKEDWFWTAGPILEDGEIPEKGYTYLASTWATPILEIDEGDAEVHRIDCYKMQSETPDWNSCTFWPELARKILEE